MSYRPQVEGLEGRLLLSGAPALAPNPGNQPEGASNSQNLVAIFSAQVIHNGPAVSDQAQSAPGARADIIQSLLGP
jgi:hypothetical protein